ncbi:MAG TPA: flagellar type III secretion system pore protein FliP [Opitutaceae bacterium]|nr:flagellar type III secretion system pore protein FliP [Opitutaceae bacterium]
MRGISAFSFLSTSILCALVFSFFLFASSDVARAQANNPPPPTVTLPVAPVAPAIPAANAPAGSAASTTPANAQPFRLNIGLEGTNRPGDVSVAIQIVIVMTLLTLAPSMVILMTSFTRIVIVLGFVRTALGVPAAPSNQIIIGLSLFLTFFLMGPVVDRVNNEAIQPYMAGSITSSVAFDRASVPLKDFMLKQTRTRDLEFFLELGRFGPTSVNDLPMRVVIPAFVISELQTAFQMGFLLFLPFLVIDFLVSSVLMALGMMMMPPTVVALPFKLLLFVLVDGWHLVVKSLVQSFTL